MLANYLDLLTRRELLVRTGMGMATLGLAGLCASEAAAETSAGPEGQVSLRLRYRPPYDWDAMLAFLAARAIPGMELVEEGTYARVVEIDGELGSVRVSRCVGENALQAEVRFPRLSALPTIIARVRRVFDLAA